MKLLPFLVCVLLCGSALAQPRNPQTQTAPPALPTEELAKYILYLQETGQLPTPAIAAPQQQQMPAEGQAKEEAEAAKFREATTGIFTGVINVFAGATLGNPVQVVSGVLSALLAVINVTVKAARFENDEEREERTKELASRIYRIMKDRPLKRAV